MTVAIHAAAVLLDMDGTLLDSSAVIERVWRDWAATHGLDLADVMAVVPGRQSHESMSVLLPHRSPEDTAADNAAMIARETSEVDGIVAVPGAADLLQSLATAPHALVTSATAELAEARMAAAGLTVPEVAVMAEHVAESKPHPEGFLAAATALGVAPEECVVFEDSAAGVAAARAAGMRVVGVGVAAAGHGADWTVRDLADVRVAEEGDAGLRIELGETV